MAITFEVEDGTGKTDATSYVSVQEYKDYWLNRGVTITETEDQIKVILNKATEWTDANICYVGEVYSLDQSLNIPRVNWYDKNGKIIPLEVPTFLKNGVCEIGKSRGDADAEVTNTGISSESYGGVSISYSGDSSHAKVIYTTAMNQFRKGRMCNKSTLRNVPT